MGFNRSSSTPENYSTPKLSLSKLPSKLRSTPVMATPPLNRLASIPFDWEEVPGKLRPDLLASSNTESSSTSESTTSSFPLFNDSSHESRPPVARCLELPPRLLNNSNNAKVVNALSPTTVLDGPYKNSNNYYEIGPFLSQGQGQRRRRSFSSLPKGSFRNLLIDHKNKGLEEEEEYGGGIGRRGGGMSNRYYCDKVIEGRENQRVFKLSSSSWRWGSFKDNNNNNNNAAAARGDMSPGFLSSKNRRGDNNNNNNSSSKFSKVKRKSSFFSFSRSRSNFLVILLFL